MKRTLVESSKQVKHAIHCVSGKGFSEVFHEWRQGCVTDCNSIQGLEVVNETPTFPILFEDAKPTGAIGCSRRFVDT